MTQISCSSWEDVEVKLLNVESLPSKLNWFNSAKRCKIHIPRFVDAGDRVVENLRKLDDSNEIFCSEEFAKKLML